MLLTVLSVTLGSCAQGDAGSSGDGRSDRTPAGRGDVGGAPTEAASEGRGRRSDSSPAPAAEPSEPVDDPDARPSRALTIDPPSWRGVEAEMRDAVCERAIPLPGGERRRASVGHVQRWVCEPGWVAADIDPERGVFHVVVGDDAARGGLRRTAELLCGDRLRRFARDLPRRVLLDLVNRLDLGPESGMRCSRTACEMPGQTEYDFSTRLNFAGEGEGFHLSSVVEIDTVLVGESTVRGYRAWANTKLAGRPARCPGG